MTSRAARVDPLSTEDALRHLRERITEADLQAAIAGLAHHLGWRCYHTRDSRGSAPGFPDLVLVRAPRVIFAELKRETGVVSEPQRQWLAALGACLGVDTYTWRPSNWQSGEIERVLRGEQ